jgi:hypothetical protein
VNVTGPLPDPLLVVRSQLAELDAVQPHPLPARTLKLPLVAVAASTPLDALLSE